jgi:hypothetical protein
VGLRDRPRGTALADARDAGAHPQPCRAAVAAGVVAAALSRHGEACHYHLPMVRVVGSQDRNEFVRDPAQALRRGRVLDRMLSTASQPVARGVLRAPHRVFNEMDDLRQLDAARRLNKRWV